ncbi:cytochrome c family protein [Fretibacter rubidus]|uniref:c-type cytochrome n=1 Tax=Fretibacter rubidus TaxID=570162 RepID=UPI00352A2D05
MKANTLKILGFCLAPVAVLTLTACGGAETPDAQTTPINSAPAATKTAATQTAAAVAVDPMARGAKLYKRCQSCHSLEQGGRHKVGPNLWAIYGAVPGSKEGFKYSAAMSSMDIVWNDETLSGYLENPRKYLPGGKMAFAGLRKAEDRDAILAYIKAQTTPAP